MQDPPPGDLEQRVIGAVLAGAPGALGLRVPPGDDAAVLDDGTAITTDALVEGVHWDGRLSAEDVGYKALAVSVSDLASIGARPDWAVLDLCLPDPVDLEWVAGFSRGLGAALRRWRVRLVGGDTTRSTGPRFAAITLGGRCVGEPLVRSGARAGDDVWVTGTLGLAGMGWMDANPPAEALAALRRPDPPLAFSLSAVAAGLLHAGMDLSDGLGADLPRLCAASGVGAEIDPAALPGHAVLGADPVRFQLSGGDDFELLLTAPPANGERLQSLVGATRLTRIGRITVGDRLSLGGGEWPRAGFAHFGRRA
jgi:thiamine-monophosphate kinase